MLKVSNLRIFIIVVTAVYIGTLLALAVYALLFPMVGGSYSIVKDYFASFASLVVWVTGSLLIGSFIDSRTKKKTVHKK